MSAPTHLVLASGGWDSATCLALALKRSRHVVALFFNYGQPYLAQELEAVRYLGRALGIAIEHRTLAAMAEERGVFKHRNLRLMLAALDAHPTATTIYFGTRNLLPAFDRFGDSNWLWAKRVGRVLGVTVITPLVGWPKARVRRELDRAGLDTTHLYSTERA